MKLKLTTINTFQGALLDAVCSFVEQQKPDIVLLQEVYDGDDQNAPIHYRSWQELQKRLDFVASDYEAALVDNQKEGAFPMGNGILSRFPVINRDVVFFNEPFNAHYTDDAKDSSNMPHVLQHVVLQTPAGEVHAYNLHGTWDLNGDNFSEKRRLISVFGEELTTTFNMQRKDNPGYATAAVDMIFVSPDVKVISKLCPQVDISDHLPLVVEVEISTEKEIQ